jgi:hypothetical protein
MRAASSLIALAASFSFVATSLAVSAPLVEMVSVEGKLGGEEGRGEGGRERRGEKGGKGDGGGGLGGGGTGLGGGSWDTSKERAKRLDNRVTNVKAYVLLLESSMTHR